eukprot:Gb_36366 [translate_table: standard]
MDIGNFTCIPIAMKITIELYVLQIISNVSDGNQISPREIVTHIPTTNIDATIILHKMLEVLAIHSSLISLVTTYENGKAKRFYFFTPLYKYLV